MGTFKGNNATGFISHILGGVVTAGLAIYDTMQVCICFCLLLTIDKTAGFTSFISHTNDT